MQLIHFFGGLIFQKLTKIPISLILLFSGIIEYFFMYSDRFYEVSLRFAAIKTSMKFSFFGILLTKLHVGDYTIIVLSIVRMTYSLMDNICSVA